MQTLAWALPTYHFGELALQAAGVVVHGDAGACGRKNLKDTGLNLGTAGVGVEAAEQQGAGRCFDQVTTAVELGERAQGAGPCIEDNRSSGGTDVS